MTQDWKRWEGQVVEGAYVLRQYLTGSEDHGLFLTEHAHKDAALKLFLAGATGAEARIARWSEAAMLSHPNLIQIHKAGRCRFDNVDLLYLVMEYADEDLSQVLAIRPLTPVETSDMLRPVLGTLEYLHRRGLAHGRIKPANIMAIGDRVKLASDSIGRFGASRAQNFKPETFTPGIYDPPEAATGAVSPAADIWSLGMTLCEVVTQSLPAWDRSQQPEPLLPEGLPEPFLDIVRNCLRPDPKLRWTIAAIAARLRGSAGPATASTGTATKTPTVAAQPISQPAGKPVPVLVSSVQKPAQKPAAQKSSGKWYALGFAAVAVAGVLVAALAGPRLFNARPQAAPASQTVAQVQPTTEPQSAPSATPEPSRPAPTPTPAPKPSGTPQDKPSAGQRIGGAPGQNPGTAQAPTPAAAPTVRVATDGVDQAEIVHQFVPNVPQKARDTITGKIRVTVKIEVDASGKVVNAELASPGPSQYFSALAVQAAQRWQFIPGQEETRERTLQFGFEKNATEVILGQATP